MLEACTGQNLQAWAQHSIHVQLELSPTHAKYLLEQSSIKAKSLVQLIEKFDWLDQTDSANHIYVSIWFKKKKSLVQEGLTKNIYFIFSPYLYSFLKAQPFKNIAPILLLTMLIKGAYPLHCFLNESLFVYKCLNI